MDRPERIQLQVMLPYKLEPRDDVRVRRLLEDGYAIEQFQRLTDKEALVTLAKESK